MWQVYVLLGVVTGIVAYLWVSGISNTHKSHPDYKGNQDGFDFDHDLKDWDVTIADGLDKLEEEEMKPIHKFNNGRGATLCHICSVIISEGLTKELYCEQCMQKKQHLIEMMQKDEKLGLYDIFNDEKRQGVKELIDKHNQHFYCSDRLELDENERCVTQCDHCAATKSKYKIGFDSYEKKEAFKEALLELRKIPMTFEPEQETLEKYSERFDNDKSEIGNPDTWGKRVKQKTLEEASWKFNPLKKLDGEFLRHAFKEGAKWQQQNSYSEEDMKKAFQSSSHTNMLDIYNSFEDFIEQFKKK